MRASRFNIATDSSVSDERLLFNTMTGALVALPRDIAELVTPSEGSPHPDAIDPTTAQVLLEQGFLVSDDHDEDAAVIERHQFGTADRNRLDVFVLPNMNCNFACPYCYEDHAPSQMSDEVADKLLRWFASVAPRFKVVLVSWFGGEPLLSFSRMLAMQQEMRRICEAAGTKLNAHITTNGYLLDPERATKLCEAGVLSYQITVDGPPDVHNERRLLKGPGDSFERVFGNLCSLAQHHPEANIKLRVNFDPHTLVRVPEMLQMVPAELRGRMHLVLERLFGETNLFIGSTVDEVARRVERVYEAAEAMGFQVTAAPLGPGKLTYCYADREHEVVFNHLGDVFKCTVSDFTSKERLGQLTESGEIRWDDDGLRSWMSVPAFEEKCFSCVYQPMCMGGCRKSRAIAGRVGDNCTHPFAALEERIRSRHASSVGSVEMSTT